MADPNRIAGTMSAAYDGKTLNVVGEATYRPSGSKRETLTGMDGVHGYSETPQPGKMSLKSRDARAVIIAALNEATNVTVVFTLANGKIIVGRNMWRVGDPIEVATEDASYTVEFEGPDVTEN